MNVSRPTNGSAVVLKICTTRSPSAAVVQLPSTSRCSRPQRRRQQPHDLVHQRPEADAAQRAHRQHRHDVAGGHRRGQRGRHTLAGQLGVREVQLEQLVVGLGDRLDQLLAARLDGRGELFGDRARAAVVAHPRLPADEVDDVSEAVASADRDRERHDLHAEALAQRGQHLLEVRVLAVHARDRHEARQRARVGLLPRHLGAALDARGGVDGDDGGVGGRRAAHHLADEVEVAGRVDEVDAVALPLERQRRQRDRVGPPVLFLVEVGDGVAVLDAAEAVDRARGEQHRLTEHRLPRPAVPHQHDVAELVGRVGVHRVRHPRARLVRGMVQRGAKRRLASGRRLESVFENDGAVRKKEERIDSPYVRRTERANRVREVV